MSRRFATNHMRIPSVKQIIASHVPTYVEQAFIRLTMKADLKRSRSGAFTVLEGREVMKRRKAQKVIAVDGKTFQYLTKQEPKSSVPRITLGGDIEDRLEAM